MPGSAADVAGCSHGYVSSVHKSVASDCSSVVSEWPEATEAGDIPVVAPDMQQLLFVEVRL